MTLAVFKRVEKLPVVNERSNKLANLLKVSLLRCFTTLVGILHIPAALPLSRVEKISLTFYLSVGERKKELKFSFVR